MAFLDIVSPEGGVLQTRVPGGATLPGIHSDSAVSFMDRGDVGIVPDITSASFIFPLLRGNGGTPTGLVSREMLFLTLTAASGFAKVWLGGEWVQKPVKVWLGSSWVQKPVKSWNGAVWVGD